MDQCGPQRVIEPQRASQDSLSRLWSPFSHGLLSGSNHKWQEGEVDTLLTPYFILRIMPKSRPPLAFFFLSQWDFGASQWTLWSKERLKYFCNHNRLWKFWAYLQLALGPSGSHASHFNACLNQTMLLNLLCKNEEYHVSGYFYHTALTWFKPSQDSPLIFDSSVCMRMNSKFQITCFWLYFLNVGFLNYQSHLFRV